MHRICLVHRVWKLHGVGQLTRFLTSLDEHEAGVPYELLVVYNGFEEGESTAAWDAALDEIAHAVLRMGPDTRDLQAYRAAVDVTTADLMCFTNSHAEVLVAAWLQMLVAPLERPDVGLTGATGSWESAFSSAPKELRLPRLRQFRRFPNPHLRSNAFAGRRELLRSLDWAAEDTKLGMHRLESGRRGLAAQVRRRGLQVLIVGADGRADPPEEWERAATFRAGGQARLLVADNRTRDYAAADPEERRTLARMAWGRRAAGD